MNADAPKRFELATFRASHWINGTQWEGREVTETETVAFGTTEIWEFVSRSPLAHPMHLHGQAFRVVERTWEDDGAAASWEQIADGVIDAVSATRWWSGRASASGSRCPSTPTAATSSTTATSSSTRTTA